MAAMVAERSDIIVSRLSMSLSCRVSAGADTSHFTVTGNQTDNRGTQYVIDELARIFRDPSFRFTHIHLPQQQPEIVDRMMNE